jgi:metallophosphoesterase (TIGR00282 family)
MKILFFGDIVGQPGRTAVAEALPKWKKEHKPDLIIANAENVNPGDVATPKILDELMSLGIEFFTYGDHFFDGDFTPLADAYPIVRPHNLEGKHPGTGVKVFETALHKQVGIINLLGHAFTKPKVTNYFTALDEALAGFGELDAIFVDFHAETTSETEAIGWYLDGKVSAVVGTHTHVPTADTRILPGGTAFQTDVGMCGAVNAVIGMDIDRANAWMRQQLGEDVPRPERKDPPPPYAADAVLIYVVGPTKSRSIKRISSRQ